MSAGNGRHSAATRSLADASRSVWLAGLGALVEVERGSREVFDRLVERGRRVERRQLKAIDRTVAATAQGVERLGEKVRESLHERIEGVLHGANVPSREDLRVLASYLDRLAERIDALEGGN